MTILQKLLNYKVLTQTKLKWQTLILSSTARQRFTEEPNEEPDTTDMLDLESEESAAQGKEQKAKGLKILTPNQMLNRLPISLAQLKAGNNSEKRKNEIRKLLYSLYR